MKKLAATEHAYARAKERLGWKKRVLNRMMAKAFFEGFSHRETKGRLRRYLDKIFLEHGKQCNNVRIYGENIYLFSDHTLVTVYRLDDKLVKYVQFCKKEYRTPSKN